MQTNGPKPRSICKQAIVLDTLDWGPGISNTPSIQLSSTWNFMPSFHNRMPLVSASPQTQDPIEVIFLAFESKQGRASYEKSAWH